MFLFTRRKPETKLKSAVLNWTPQYSSSFSLKILNEITTYPILRATFLHRFLRGTQKSDFADNAETRPLPT